MERSGSESDGEESDSGCDMDVIPNCQQVTENNIKLPGTTAHNSPKAQIEVLQSTDNVSDAKNTA